MLDVELDRHAGDLHLNVRFVLPGGSVTALLGPNGAGKSATLAALLGHIGPALIDPPVGWAPQRGGLLPRLRPRDQVSRFANDRNPLLQDGTIDDLLAEVGIDPSDRRAPRRLSVGEAQRVTVLRALLASNVTLLDEPTAAQDVTGAVALRRVIRRHADRGATVLLASHDPIDAHALADGIVVLEQGTVTGRGSAAELAATSATPYIARVAGATVLEGTVTSGRFAGTWGELTVSDATPEGPGVAVIRPSAVVLHESPPAATSARNVLTGVVADVVDLPEAVLVRIAGNPDLVAALTHAAATALDIRTGRRVTATVKANEIVVTPR